MEASAKVETRRVLMEMARRRQRSGTGSAVAFVRRRTAQVRFPDLRTLLGSLPWAVVGAAATRMYMPERASQDLDILVRSEDAAESRRKMSDAGYRYQGELSIGVSTWLTDEGFPVDVIECQEAWCAQALEQAQSNRDAAGSPVLPLPYLVLLKVQAGRVQDLADVTRMLGLASPEQMDAVRAAFDRWLPEAKEDLESLIALGELETRPPPP